MCCPTSGLDLRVFIGMLERRHSNPECISAAAALAIARWAAGAGQSEGASSAAYSQMASESHTVTSPSSPLAVTCTAGTLPVGEIAVCLPYACPAPSSVTAAWYAVGAGANGRRCGCKRAETWVEGCEGVCVRTHARTHVGVGTIVHLRVRKQERASQRALERENKRVKKETNENVGSERGNQRTWERESGGGEFSALWPTAC
jgi:hypothetical protein